MQELEVERGEFFSIKPLNLDEVNQQLEKYQRLHSKMERDLAFNKDLIVHLYSFERFDYQVL
jgi:hypothetical protein